MTISNFKQKTNCQYRNNRFTYTLSLQCKCINKAEKPIRTTSYDKKMYIYYICVSLSIRINCNNFLFDWIGVGFEKEQFREEV